MSWTLISLVSEITHRTRVFGIVDSSFVSVERNFLLPLLDTFRSHESSHYTNWFCSVRTLLQVSTCQISIPPRNLPICCWYCQFCSFNASKIHIRMNKKKHSGPSVDRHGIVEHENRTKLCKSVLIVISVLQREESKYSLLLHSCMHSL